MQHLNTCLRSWIFESPVKTHLLNNVNLSTQKRPVENIFPLQKFLYFNFCIKIPHSTCLKDFTTIIHFSTVHLYQFDNQMQTNSALECELAATRFPSSYSFFNNCSMSQKEWSKIWTARGRPCCCKWWYDSQFLGEQP
jgi:hypothetical protein